MVEVQNVLVGLHLRVVGQVVDGIDVAEDEVAAAAGSGSRRQWFAGEDLVEDLDGGGGVGGVRACSSNRSSVASSGRPTARQKSAQ
jgi:hypothetical protein